MNKLKLNKEIYSRNDIEATASAFEKIADFFIDEDSLNWVCAINNPKANVNRIKKEFENYLIGVSNHRR